METKTLSKPALEILDQYLHFKAGSAICSIPYFNNKTTRARAALRTYIGKGNPEDIREEFETIISKNKIDLRSITGEALKKLLVDKGLGIECSGFCYHILEAESKSRKQGNLSKHITFINCKGFIGQIRCAVRPTENCDVETFADDSNSQVIPVEKVKPGDIITILSEKKEGNHILVVYDVKYKDTLPVEILYAHSIAYPEDGIYGTGVRVGSIEINNPNASIAQQKWIEDGKDGDANPLFSLRIKKGKTEIRRLVWF